jgi:hypothetical protein
LDICTFVLHHPEGTDRYELLTSDVRRFGTIALHQERIRAISDAYVAHSADLRDKHDPLRPISKDKKEYFLSKKAILSAIEDGEAMLKENCNKAIRWIIRDAWMRRDPNAPAWSAELPVLLIGGGGRAEFFRDIVAELDPWLTGVMHNDGTRSVEVSVPKTVCTKTTDHDRLVVAWGLSNQEFNIGQITPADKISDVEPQKTNEGWKDRFVDKEQV